MRLSARESGQGPAVRRCPLCLEAGGQPGRIVTNPGLLASWVACDRCGTAYHESCAREFGTCATLGCERAAGLVFPRIEPSRRLRAQDGALYLPSPLRLGCLTPFTLLTLLGLSVTWTALSLLFEGHLSAWGFLPSLPLVLLTGVLLYLAPWALIHSLAREVVHLEPGQVRIETRLGGRCSYVAPLETIDRCVVTMTRSAEWKVMLLNAEGKTLRKFAYRLLSLEDSLFVAQEVEAHVRAARAALASTRQSATEESGPEKDDTKREHA